MSDADKPSNKADIRRHYLNQRRTLTNREVDAQSRAAAQRLCSHSTYLEARCVHAYVTGKDNELNARILLTSTSEVYGTAEGEIMDEEHALKPMSPYASAKAGADRVLPETIEASLMLAAATLDAVGQSAEETEACLGQLRADGYAQLLPLVVGRHQDDGADH